MPIINNTYLRSYGTPSGLGLFFLNPSAISGNLQLISKSGIIGAGQCLSEVAPSDFSVNALGSPGQLVTLHSTLSFFNPSGLFEVAAQPTIELTVTSFAEAVVGDVPASVNPKTAVLNLFSVDNYPVILRNQEALSFSRFFLDQGHLLSISGGPTVHLLTLTGVDGTGPRIVNETPASGSSFNDPSTQVAFELKDLEITAINPSEVYLYINNVLVVSGGTALTTSGFGVTTFQNVSPSFYLFSFTPDPDFSLGSEVVISGTARDVVPPSGNISSLYYSYTVWDAGTLMATIEGLPDTLSPYISFSEPTNLEADVSVTSNIQVDLVDDHTGLDFASVVMYLEDQLIVSGGVGVSPSLVTVSSTVISGGRGRSYTLNPVDNLSYSQVVNIEVLCQDLYTPAPNTFSGGISFTTVSNQHLAVSGLQVLGVSGYEDLFLQESLPATTTGTGFRTSFYNFLGTDISTTGSYISCNGQLVSGISFIPVISGFEYEVYFNLTPDFTTDCDLVFHAQQVPLVSGNEVFREFSTELLWGAEYCYDPATNFSYDTEVPIVIQVGDLGDLPSLGSLVSKFKTAPQAKNDLYAWIVGENTPQAFLEANMASNNPFFEYGKVMNVEVEATDFAGNKMVYTYSFTIEQG